MDIKDIQNLIKFVAKSGANEVKLIRVQNANLGSQHIVC